MLILKVKFTSFVPPPLLYQQEKSVKSGKISYCGKRSGKTWKDCWNLSEN